MNEFLKIRSGYFFNFKDFDSVIENKIINTIAIRSNDIENRELKWLYKYLLVVYNSITSYQDSVNEGLDLETKDRETVYHIKYENSTLYVTMGFVYDMKKTKDIIQLKHFITLLDNRNDNKDIENIIDLVKSDRFILFNKNNIDVVSFKKVLNDLIHNEIDHDDMHVVYTIGNSQGKGEYYLETFTDTPNKIIINYTIPYNMLENDNVTKLYNFIEFLYSAIIHTNILNDTILNNFDIECDSTEDPITSEEWDGVPNKYKIPKGKYPDLSQCYELTSLLQSFESNLSTTVYDVPQPQYPFDPYTKIPISSDTLYSLLNIYDKYNKNSPEIYPHLTDLKIMSFLLPNYENIIKDPLQFREKFLSYDN